MLSEMEKLLVGASQMKNRKLEKCVVGALFKGGIHEHFLNILFEHTFLLIYGF